MACWLAILKDATNNEVSRCCVSSTRVAPRGSLGSDVVARNTSISVKMSQLSDAFGEEHLCRQALSVPPSILCTLQDSPGLSAMSPTTRYQACVQWTRVSEVDPESRHAEVVHAAKQQFLTPSERETAHELFPCHPSNDADT